MLEISKSDKTAFSESTGDGEVLLPREMGCALHLIGFCLNHTHFASKNLSTGAGLLERTVNVVSCRGNS